MELRFEDNEVVVVKDGQVVKLDEDELEKLESYADLVYGRRK